MSWSTLIRNMLEGGVLEAVDEPEDGGEMEAGIPRRPLSELPLYNEFFSTVRDCIGE